MWLVHDRHCLVCTLKNKMYPKSIFSGNFRAIVAYMEDFLKN